MSLQERIETDLISAMKQKDEVKLNVLRALKSAAKNSQIQKQKELEEADFIQLIQSQIKSRRDSVELYEKGGRPELAQKEMAEINILTEYLPEQMSADEVRVIVKKAIQESGAQGQQEMGKVMALVMPQLRGKADGSLISQIVKEELQ